MGKYYRTDCGEMRKRIQILLPSTTRTPSGETTGDPTPVCYAWARILPATGTESWIAKELQEITSHRINMRYQPGITAQMFATFQGRQFNFTSVRDLEERHEELEILAKEVISE